MPRMVKVAPNPAYKPTPETKAAWDKIKGQPARELAYVTAMENVKQSGGMYAFAPDAPTAAPTVSVLQPEDMSNDDLKLTAQRFGIDLTKKQMKKAEIVKAIRIAMDKIEILDDDADEDVPA